MITILLLLVINIATSILGVYLFDYQIDNAINSPIVIILSIITGTIIMLIVFFLYLEIGYLLLAKKLPPNSKIKHFFAKEIMTIPLFLTNTRVKVIGKENLPLEPGFSVYSNHTSMMDIPILMCKLNKYPVAFLSKEEVTEMYTVGKWARNIGCVLIDRSNDRKGAEAIINVIRNIKNGLTMVIFPEGTFSNEVGKLIEFKPGSFKVALKSKAPLVPITIFETKIVKKMKWPFPKRITIVIHQAIPFNEYKEMTSHDLANKVKTTIESAL